MITTDIRDGIATLSIDMPDRSMNVLTPALAEALRAAFDAVVADAGVTGIIIASGKRDFIAGADLGQMAALAALPATGAMAGIAVYGDLFRRIETAGKPVVAAASGTALGGGLELMLACHYRVAADQPRARFGLPEVTLGLLPGAGGTQRLPRLIGMAASLPLLTGGGPLSAQAALKAGILHEVVAPGQLLTHAAQALQDGRVSPQAAWDAKGFRVPGGEPYTPANIAMLTAANARSNAATRGNYPAPRTILRCVYEGIRLPMDKALRLEQKHFATLVRGNVAQGMIRTLFFARQAADKLARRPQGLPPTRVARLGVIGAGFMGAGIAQASALAGIDVVLLDRSPEAALQGRDGIARGLARDLDKGRLTAEAASAALARIRAGRDYADLADCELVIEAVFEDVGIKEGVTRAAEAAMPDSAIFASNTSALPINDLARASVRRDRFIGLHFFSPVPQMALVEVIVGSETSPEVLARSLDYIRQIGKTPIIVNDGYGFYTTRCVDAYVREGLRLLADGVDPQLVEAAGLALGMPVGPLALGDEIGLEVMQHIAHFFRAREAGDWADDRHGAANALLDRLVADGRYGRKKLAGFHAYPEGAAKQLDRAYLAFLPLLDEQPALADIRERLLYAQLVEAARCWAEGIITDAGEADLGAVLGWSFPSWLGGPLAAIDGIGPGRFAATADALAERLGARFTLPRQLRDMAAAGTGFHGRR